MVNVMAQNGQPSGSHGFAHVPHDSALSVGSSKEEDAAKIRELEEEVMTLAEKANSACMFRQDRLAWRRDRADRNDM